MAIFEKIEPTDARISVDFLVQKSRLKSIFEYDQDFRFCALKIEIEKPEGTFNFGDKLKAIEKYFTRKYRPIIQDVARALPKGLTLQVETGKYSSYWKRYTERRTYYIYIEASAEFSKQAFKDMAIGNIVHLSTITPTFLNDANDFKQRILSNREDVLKKMISRLKYRNPLKITSCDW